MAVTNEELFTDLTIGQYFDEQVAGDPPGVGGVVRHHDDLARPRDHVDPDLPEDARLRERTGRHPLARRRVVQFRGVAVVSAAGDEHVAGRKERCRVPIACRRERAGR